MSSTKKRTIIENGKTNNGFMKPDLAIVASFFASIENKRYEEVAKLLPSQEQIYDCPKDNDFKTIVLLLVDLARAKRWEELSLEATKLFYTF